MAASDLAALFASVGISFWTQRSFKQPLLFSAAACLAGEQLQSVIKGHLCLRITPALGPSGCGFITPALGPAGCGLLQLSAPLDADYSSIRPCTLLLLRISPSIQSESAGRSNVAHYHPMDAGNILFVLSYKWRSLPVLLAARLLNGCGSARTANRRYTADYVSRAQRTMASAGERGYLICC